MQNKKTSASNPLVSKSSASKPSISKKLVSKLPPLKPSSQLPVQNQNSLSSARQALSQASNTSNNVSQNTISLQQRLPSIRRGPTTSKPLPSKPVVKSADE